METMKCPYCVPPRTIVSVDYWSLTSMEMLQNIHHMWHTEPNNPYTHGRLVE